MGEERDSDSSLPFPGAGASPLPARVRRQGLADSFPFQSGKPPPCPHPRPGLRGLEEETCDPKGSPPAPPSCARTLGLPLAWGCCGPESSDKEESLAAPSGAKPSLQLPTGDMCQGLVRTDTPRTVDGPHLWNLGSGTGVLEGRGWGGVVRLEATGETPASCRRAEHSASAAREAGSPGPAVSRARGRGGTALGLPEGRNGSSPTVHRCPSPP